MTACEHLGYQCAEGDLIDAVYCRHDNCGGDAKHHADIRVTNYGSWATCCKDEGRRMPCLSAVSMSCSIVLGMYLL